MCIVFAQPEPPPSLPQPASLAGCIRYALEQQPLIRQAQTDEAITERTIQIALSNWFPQLALSANLTHNTQLSALPPVSTGAPVRQAFVNTSSIQFSVSQTIFDRDALLAGVTKEEVREQSRQRRELTSIDIIVNVSKAYYAVLVTENQLAVLADDIVRLQRNLEDARSQYRSGVVDKTDYQRATITLNNVQAEEFQTRELLKARLSFLKQQMGYPDARPLELESDSTSTWENEMRIDTLQRVDYRNRLEFRQAETERRLQEASVHYSQWGFLPTLSAFGAYTLSYQADELPVLYDQSYRGSYIGLRLSLPLFEGGRRLEEISRARLELERTEWDIEREKQSIDAEFAQALASYKGNLRNYRALEENAELAREVYAILQLQYKSGIKSYLDVLTAENDLRSAEANRTNALYQVISGKLDMQKALGLIRGESP